MLENEDKCDMVRIWEGFLEEQTRGVNWGVLSPTIASAVVSCSREPRDKGPYDEA